MFVVFGFRRFDAVSELPDLVLQAYGVGINRGASCLRRRSTMSWGVSEKRCESRPAASAEI